MKNLTRNRFENCVMARVMRGGKRHQKNFSLTKYKTWEMAEKEGARWLSLVTKRLPPTAPRRERMTKANRSGVVGVFFHVHVVRKKTHSLTYYRWIARWHDCPNRGGVAWYIKDSVSNDDAFVLANLSLKLRTVDRDRVWQAFRRASKNGQYEKILATKKYDGHELE